MLLDGMQIKNLKLAFLDAGIEMPALRQVAYTVFDSDTFLPDNVSLNDAWFEILKLANARDKDHLMQLMEEVEQLNSYNENLQNVLKTTRALLHGHGNDAEVSIGDLPALMIVPDVREAVKAFSDTFEQSSQRITAMTVYKRVHDILHDLQYGDYARIVYDAEKFPDEAEARKLIFNHVLQMKKYVEKADNIVQEATARRGAISDIRDQLKEISESLNAADEQQDKTLCELAIKQLRALLSGTQPAYFNTYLNDAAHTLNMPGLVAAMTGVHNAIVKTKLDAAKAERFKLGLDDLAHLDQELSGRIQEHDTWQGIHDTLRRISDSGHGAPARLLSELDLFWSGLSEAIKKACEQGGRMENGKTGKRQIPGWASDLLKETTMLEKAKTAGNQDRAKERFDRLLQQEAERFHDVDKNLLQVCENISKVKSPLQRLAEILP